MVSLYMLSFKSNNIHTIPAESLSPSIGWLILTDNHIEELPSSIGCLSKLRKCMLAGNRLTTLPDEMQQCTEIELLRLSANRLTNLPQWLLKLPKLSWLAYSGNDIATKRADVKDSEAIINSGIPSISWSDLTMEQQLGEGASGNVYRALWQKKDAPTALSASSPALSGDDGNAMGTSIFRSMGDAREGSAEGGGSSLSGISGSHLEVAVKLFKGEKTSDGLPEDEMKVGLIHDLYCLVAIFVRICNHCHSPDHFNVPKIYLFSSYPGFDACFVSDHRGSGQPSQLDRSIWPPNRDTE